MNNTIFYSIQQIFEDNLSTQEFIYPIRCFTQKHGIFYICDKNEEGKPDWRQQTFEELVLIIKKIQNGLMKELTQWKTINQNKFDQNDKLSILFNKAVIKLMSINFTQDNNFSRMKNGFYNYLKKDLTSFEFDFEF
jgi:hypothetical protein